MRGDERPLTREWTPPGPLDLRLVLGPLRRGPADPTFRMAPDGTFWRATRTPEGPGTLRVAGRGDRVGAQAWGPGAEWLLAACPPFWGPTTTRTRSPRTTACSPWPGTAAPACGCCARAWSWSR